MDFAPKPGCPMCGIVASAQRDPLASPTTRPRGGTGSLQPEILWRDDNFTIYRERAHPVSSKGHIIIAFNLHVPSIYTLSSSDLPLLAAVKTLATKQLSGLLAAGNLSTPSSPLTPGTPGLRSLALGSTPIDASQFKIGFITPPFRDNKIPVTDHLHAHAYIQPADLAGWWRSVAYGPLAWYSIDDLIAEIRESTSNNRIRSGYDDTGRAERKRPIDQIPDAGARTGTAYGVDMTDPGIASPDLETGEGPVTPLATRPLTPNMLSPVPHLSLSPPS
ncbi:hypothetical protein PUNSTDRAFT_94807 [Punctularia strigosozonata HHB-11173 SS5]|uniref:uncharacterized protein n=1 Tax=Punctularia strigosozonata (strain HHB-11173) TaxID=741275 RepID=UPI0004417CAC|nr:uncharacterized protein PUNSTDRAFT_94807 [Punctularia strigosozonata HHB-11173 SS5]EIN13623.1 hypothetical protein PUNSTDRAFT_94807 [Punctularia strigosozonata HHB-11173 SS5]